jgi:hypothetical protein
MPDNAKYCGHCGMSLNKRSERLMHLSNDFAWIARRGWAGFSAGFLGWLVAFIISRMVGQHLGEFMTNFFTGTICGVFLGTVGGIIEESAYKAFLGGLLGAVGGAVGGLINIPATQLLQGPLPILITWAVGGMFIGATSGIIEKRWKKVLAGMLFGLLGGAIGGYLGSIFYGSVHLEFEVKSWLGNRLAEGLSGGLVGAILWFFIGLIEKLYIFHRREEPRLEYKACDFCGKHNPLKSWYCGHCGHVLQISAARQKVETTPFHGMERVVNGLRFLSWLFGATGFITTPVVFIIFLVQDIFLAFVAAVFAVLITYLMVVGFRFAADMLTCFMRLSGALHDEKGAAE